MSVVGSHRVRRICPLTKSPCTESDCAMFHRGKNKCSFLVIAEEIENLVFMEEYRGRSGGLRDI